MKGNDIIASVIASSSTGLNGRNWDDSGGGRWNGCGSAVFENSAIASLVIRGVAVEHVNIEARITSGVTDSLSWNLRLFTWAATASMLVPVAPVAVLVANGSLSADLEE
jgi:hypothetical protein